MRTRGARDRQPRKRRKNLTWPGQRDLFQTSFASGDDVTVTIKGQQHKARVVASGGRRVIVNLVDDHGGIKKWTVDTDDVQLTRKGGQLGLF